MPGTDRVRHEQTGYALGYEHEKVTTICHSEREDRWHRKRNQRRGDSSEPDAEQASGCGGRERDSCHRQNTANNVGHAPHDWL